MRILLATVQAPFIYGGAEILADELCKALQSSGHEAEIIAIPFQVYPPERILDTMLISRLLDVESFNGSRIDRVIGLKFPAYLMPHSCKVLWLLHQHRQAYELWGDPIYGGLERSPNGLQVRESIVHADNRVASECRSIFTISQTVVDRLKQFNNVDSIALYHPPQNAELLHCDHEEGYFFFPSRMNAIKRQDLVLEALAKTLNPVKIIFAGQPEGNFEELLTRKVKELELGDRAIFVGRINNEEKIEYYAKSLGVIYTPFEEDYGYVTLEGMLSSKPVVTCRDSGGPLEFIRDRETGLITEPNPLSLAQAIDELWENRTWATKLGQSALSYYRSLNITWSNVLQHLLA
ncbi:MAG: glycosyltransferase family 4 protein [Snowella sp.]|nr:glycosyltransferase family 4 protein [Snowella sp.]